MEIKKLIKKLLVELGITQTELAKKVGQTQANLSRKIVSDNFRINDLEKLVNALGCTLEVNIILPNGKKL